MAEKNFYVDLKLIGTTGSATIALDAANDTFSIVPTAATRIAIGKGAVVGAINAIAIGEAAVANGVNSLALGQNITSTAANSGVISLISTAVSNANVNTLEIYTNGAATPSAILSDTQAQFKHLIGVGTRNVMCDVNGNLLSADATDLVSDWTAATAYVINSEITALSPSTGHRTLYRATIAFTSGLTFSAAEEGNWTAVATVGEDRLHADDTTTAPATAGAPTTTEIATFAATNNFMDGLIFYTGDDLPATTPTYVFWVDAAGVATQIEGPSASASSFAADITLVAGVGLLVTHSLASTDIVIQFKNALGVMVELDTVDLYTANTVRVESSTSGIFRIIIK